MIFAISMVYTVFLLSSAKEHWDRTHDPKEAMVGALAHSGRVIFAAGAVMVAVFLTFALSGPLPPKEMGIILGVALVLLDAALVRLLLLPVLLRRWASGRGISRAGHVGSSPRSPSDTPEQLAQRNERSLRPGCGSCPGRSRHPQQPVLAASANWVGGLMPFLRSRPLQMTPQLLWPRRASTDRRRQTRRAERSPIKGTRQIPRGRAPPQTRRVRAHPVRGSESARACWPRSVSLHLLLAAIDDIAAASLKEAVVNRLRPCRGDAALIDVQLPGDELPTRAAGMLEVGQYLEHALDGNLLVGVAAGGTQAFRAPNWISGELIDTLLREPVTRIPDIRVATLVFLTAFPAPSGTRAPCRLRSSGARARSSPTRASLSPARRRRARSSGSQPYRPCLTSSALGR